MVIILQTQRHGPGIAEQAPGQSERFSVPRVASEPSVLHTRQHHPMGQRDRTADARQQPGSPFALLVGSADTPPPSTKDRGERAAASRTSTTDETAAGRGPAPKDSGAPASNPPKQDEPTTAVAAVPADAK